MGRAAYLAGAEEINVDSDVLHLDEGFIFDHKRTVFNVARCRFRRTYVIKSNQVVEFVCKGQGGRACEIGGGCTGNPHKLARLARTLKDLGFTIGNRNRRARRAAWGRPGERIGRCRRYGTRALDRKSVV